MDAASEWNQVAELLAILLLNTADQHLDIRTLRRLRDRDLLRAVRVASLAHDSCPDPAMRKKWESCVALLQAWFSCPFPWRKPITPKDVRATKKLLLSIPGFGNFHHVRDDFDRFAKGLAQNRVSIWWWGYNARRGQPVSLERIYKIATIEFLKRADYSEQEALDMVARLLATQGKNVDAKKLRKDLDLYAKQSAAKASPYPPVLQQNDPHDLVNWCLDNMVVYNRPAVGRVLRFASS